jgi:thioredoxin reductase (NADPH)
MNTSPHKVAVIGSGPSGLTAALYTARASLDTTVFTGIQPGGQLTTTTEIENFPGFIDGIMGPELMDNMQKQAERFGAKVQFSQVNSIKLNSDSNQKKFTVFADTGDESFDAVIVASGASAKYLGIPGEEEWIGKGYHSCATCDGFFYRGKVIAVVGGGDSAMEEANFLTKFASKVYLIHRSESFRASKIMADRAKANDKIEFVLNTKITEFITEGEDFKGVKLESTQDGTQKDLTLDGVFVAIGHIPNSGFAKGILTMDEAGYLQPVSRTMSDVEGIFIAGDVEDQVYRQAITAAGQGCKAAMDCEKWLESISN